MKVLGLIDLINNPREKVVILDAVSRRECFRGLADDLADYSGAEYRRVVKISVKDNTLIVETKV